MSSIIELEKEFELKPTFNFSKQVDKEIGFKVIEYNKCYIFNANLYFNQSIVKYIKFIYNNKLILPFDPYKNNERLKKVLKRL